MPIEGVAVGATSLATIFLVAIAAIYGWPAAAVAGLLAMAFVEVARRRPISRIAFNCGVYVIAGIAAGTAAATIHGGTLFHLVVGTIAAAVSFYLVDITLLAAVVSRSRQLRFLSSLRNYVHLTLMPFAIMASLTVVLVVLWDRSPYVAVVLAGPLLATAIYQRWIHGALERLREFDRLKDEFIAIVSHELRTPLTSVYGAALTLRNRELDDTRRNLLLDIVSTESARLGRLLDDVLWVSRLDSGGAEPFITRVEPRELVSDVVDATRTHLPPGLSLDFRFDSASLPVAADPDRLRQVLVNLIENAVKYSGQGRIEVRVQPQYETTRFSVRDEGRGIPERRGRAGLREVLSPRSQHDRGRGGNRSGFVHLPRAHRRDAGTNLGQLGAGQRLDVHFRASSLRAALIPLQGERVVRAVCRSNRVPAKCNPRSNQHASPPLARSVQCPGRAHCHFSRRWRLEVGALAVLG